MIRIIIIATAIFLFNIHCVFSQEESYRTDEGTIVINSVFNDSQLIAYSNNLKVILNYESSDIIMQLDKSTLKTRVDTLDRKLKKLAHEYIEFQGKTGIDYINTKGHPIQNFEIKGELQIGRQKKMISGKGTLEHLFEGTEYACRITWSTG